MFKKLLFSLLFSMAAFTSNAQSIGMIGAFNSWSGDVVMNTTDNVNFSLNAYTFTISGEMKFRQNADWAVNWGAVDFPAGVGTQGGSNIPVPAGSYDITFNITTGAYLFTPVVLGFDNIGIYGGFNAWGPAEAMITTDGIDYSKTDFHYTAADVKFIKDNDATMTWGGTTFPAGIAVAGGTAIPLMHGYYNANFNKSTLAYSFIEVPVGIIGSGIGGWGDADEMAMTSTDGGVNFTMTGITLFSGEVKFRANSSWATNWGAVDFPSGTAIVNGQPGNANIPTLPGVYDIAFNRTTGVYSFVLVSATVDNYGITGAFNTAATAVAMDVDATGNDYYKKDMYFSAPNVHFIKDNDPMLVYGGTGFPMGTATLAGGEIPLTVGFYNVSFKKDTGAYAFTDIPVSMVGDFTNWGGSPDVDMMSTDGGINFSAMGVVFAANSGLKFRTNHDWALSWGGPDFPMGVATSAGGPNINVIAGTYNVSFNRLTGEYSFADPAAATTTFDKNVVSVYPNPTSNVWNFKTNNTQVSSIAIADISGKIVMTKNIMASEFAIDASTFASGLYFATIKVGDKTNTVKIIKN